MHSKAIGKFRFGLSKQLDDFLATFHGLPLGAHSYHWLWAFLKAVSWRPVRSVCHLWAGLDQLPVLQRERQLLPRCRRGRQAVGEVAVRRIRSGLLPLCSCPRSMIRRRASMNGRGVRPPDIVPVQELTNARRPELRSRTELERCKGGYHGGSTGAPTFSRPDLECVSPLYARHPWVSQPGICDPAA